jgi:hypothetical protein
VRAALVALLLAASPATEIVEPATGVHFAAEPNYAGVAFRCVASGVRLKWFIQVYGIAFCLERTHAEAALSAAAAQAGAREAPALRKSVTFFEALRDANLAKAAHLIFVRDVPREMAADALAQAVIGSLGDQGAERVAKLRAMVTRDVKKGEELVLTTLPDGSVHVTIGSEDHSLVDPLVARLIWGVWLSPEGVSPSLAEALAQSAAH